MRMNGVSFYSSFLFFFIPHLHFSSSFLCTLFIRERLLALLEMTPLKTPSRLRYFVLSWLETGDFMSNHHSANGTDALPSLKTV